MLMGFKGQGCVVCVTRPISSPLKLCYSMLFLTVVSMSGYHVGFFHLRFHLFVTLSLPLCLPLTFTITMNYRLLRCSHLFVTISLSLMTVFELAGSFSFAVFIH